ncbi:MAG: CoA pyrophosphatase [Deltaproteobacteria bacterium]|nr:CoA pyrophosphatase [Deltaproteobacteria bacterium]
MTDHPIDASIYQILKARLLAVAPRNDTACTPAAVLIPIILKNNAPHVIFTRRSMTVATHKGQVSFPGGMMEPSDASAVDTALREAFEEIGLPAANVTAVGYLDGLRTITDFWITPVVGIVHTPFEYRPEEAEVAEVFDVPLTMLQQLDRWQIGERNYNGINYRDYRFPWNGHTIWGATGKLTFALIERMGQSAPD